jgi:hypothetical protein
MKLYLFRYKKNVFGGVYAKNGEDLFWEIDAFLDPNDVEIQEIKRFGFCLNRKITKYKDEIDIEYKEIEMSHYVDEDKWIKPDWDKLRNKV